MFFLNLSYKIENIYYYYYYILKMKNICLTLFQIIDNKIKKLKKKKFQYLYLFCI